MTFDAKSEAGARIAKRLRDDQIGWLVTVHKGEPRPVPVWFLWDGGAALLVYSEPGALKVRSIDTHPRCALHFNSDATGGEIAVVSGEIARAPDAPAMLDNPPYMAKYDEAVKAYTRQMQQTVEEVNAAFNVALRMTIDDARGW